MRSKEIISRYLSLFNNNSFRKSEDVESVGYIHEEQINAAKKVVCELSANILRTNHVILVAKMQSGKTGTCNAITNMIMNTRLKRELAVNKVLYITGMNDCGLANQTCERVLEQVISATETNIYDGTKATKNNTNSSFYVLKNSNLKKFEDDLNGSLIFIDEAHFGSKERNVLTKFMLSKGIDWKNRNSLIANNIYIVSVSATPFEEIISDTEDCKPMIILETDDNYIGVSEYIEKGLVHQATKDDIEDGTIFEYIQNAYERMNENSEKGIVIVRTRKFDTFYENKFITDNFNIHQMFANGSKIEYDRFNAMIADMVKKNNVNNHAHYNIGKIKNAISVGDEKSSNTKEIDFKPTLVLIKGAFRAGITIPREAKDLIYMIYDFSAGADTTAQALLGRMCGYRDLEHAMFNTHFYLNSVFAQMYADWENDFTNKELIPCSKTKWTWMDNNYEGNDVKFGTKPCGNFTVDLTENELREIYYYCGQGKQQNKVTAQMIPQILKKHHKDIEYDYFIEAYMSGKNNYAKSTQEKRFDAFNAESLVFQIDPEKNKDFKKATGRNQFTKEDIGKKAIGVVFDATVEYISSASKIVFGGNRRLLIYYVEVGQKKRMTNHQTQYQAHKDTALLD